MPLVADPYLSVVAALPSLSALLRHRAAVQPDDRAYVALSDRGREDAVITFEELDRRAVALARRLADRAVPGGYRVSRRVLRLPLRRDYWRAVDGAASAKRA